MCRFLSGPVVVLRYLHSLVPSSAPGFSSVSSHPSMVIWVQSKKVCVICTYNWILSTETFLQVAVDCKSRSHTKASTRSVRRPFCFVIRRIYISRSDYCQDQDAFTLNHGW